MARVLVTGATGFVGANLVRRLLADGHEVHCTVRPGHATWRIDDIRPDLRLHVVDLADEDEVRAKVARIRPDWVFHLAAHGAYPAQTNLAEMIRTNVQGTVNLVEACVAIGFEAFVNTGSSSEYGWKDHAPAETEPLEPNSHYAVTKASATQFCRLTGRAHGVRLTTLRLYSVYGPWEEPTRLMPTLIRRGRRGELPPLVDPDVARDYVYVDDVVEAYLVAATHDGQELGSVFNVGTGVQTTLRAAVAVARRVLGLAAEPIWGSMPNRSWDTTVWVADIRAIGTALGWAPRHGFESGFRRMVAWFADRPESDWAKVAGYPFRESRG